VPHFKKEKIKHSVMDAIKFVNEQTLSNNNGLDFGPGDNVEVSYRIIEGAKERIQIYRGDVIQIKGHGLTKTFTVRKISNGVGVERIFPISSPNIAGIKVMKRGRVRRARLYYLRSLVGKAARIKEKTSYAKG
jgi:large subunit ribosomal protein L19